MILLALLYSSPLRLQDDPDRPSTECRVGKAAGRRAFECRVSLDQNAADRSSLARPLASHLVLEEERTSLQDNCRTDKERAHHCEKQHQSEPESASFWNLLEAEARVRPANVQNASAVDPRKQRSPVWTHGAHAKLNGTSPRAGGPTCLIGKALAASGSEMRQTFWKPSTRFQHLQSHAASHLCVDMYRAGQPLPTFQVPDSGVQSLLIRIYSFPTTKKTTKFGPESFCSGVLLPVE